MKIASFVKKNQPRIYYQNIYLIKVSQNQTLKVIILAKFFTPDLKLHNRYCHNHDG